MSRLANIDLRLLNIFKTVVDTGGFTHAQADLNINLSTISNHMNALEQRLGMTLCTRGRSGFHLTVDGETVYEEIERLFEAMHRFESRVGSVHGRLRGTLSVGILDNTITDPAAPLHKAIRQFIDRSSQVTLTLVTRPPNELLRELLDGRLDVVIGSFPRAVLGLEYIPLYDEEHRFYCGQSHPLFEVDEKILSIDELGRHPLISRGYWAARDVKHIPTTIPVSQVNDMEAQAQLILSGRFMGYLPVHYAKQWEALNLLRVMLPDELSYKAPFHIAHTKAVAQHPVPKTFIKDTVSVFAEK